MADITQDVFFPAFGAAIQDLGGVYNPHYYNESYLPENNWQRLRDALQARLGTSEWQVAAQVPPNQTCIGAQYTGPDGTRRTLPILFQRVPFKLENGIQMVKVKKVTTNAAGGHVRWAWVQTTIPSEDLPNSQERAPLGVRTCIDELDGGSMRDGVDGDAVPLPRAVPGYGVVAVQLECGHGSNKFLSGRLLLRYPSRYVHRHVVLGTPPSWLS